MGKPSIFSNDYGQRMKKRRKMTVINTILFILIIISAAYFGGNYYLEKKGLDFGISFKWFKEKPQDKQSTADSSNKPKPNNETQSQGSSIPEQQEEKKTAFYEYKAADGKLYELEYVEVSGNKEFTGVESEQGQVGFDISADKKKIVFCTNSGDVVVGDIMGVVKKINSDSYKSKSSGITIEKETTLKYYPEYIWAAKPHFTSDNRIVYLTYLPYLKGASNFYMWVLSIDGSSHRMVGKLSDDINKIVYDGFSGDGALRIKVNDKIYYLPSGSYGLTE